MDAFSHEVKCDCDTSCWCCVAGGDGGGSAVPPLRPESWSGHRGQESHPAAQEPPVRAECWRVAQLCCFVHTTACWVVRTTTCWVVRTTSCWVVCTCTCWVVCTTTCWVVCTPTCWVVCTTACWIVCTSTCWIAHTTACWVVCTNTCWVVHPTMLGCLYYYMLGCLYYYMLGYAPNHSCCIIIIIGGWANVKHTCAAIFYLQEILEYKFVSLCLGSFSLLMFGCTFCIR